MKMFLSKRVHSKYLTISPSLPLPAATQMIMKMLTNDNEDVSL